MAYMQTKLYSHAFKVKALYKEALRHLQSHYPSRHVFRYHAVLLRARFDENKNEIDVRKSVQMLKEGEEELFLKQHPQRMRFVDSPQGIAYGREPYVPDWIYDTWHPLERQQYPTYFATREKRKQEYIEQWQKKYGQSEYDPSP